MRRSSVVWAFGLLTLASAAGCLPRKSGGFEGGSRVRTPRPSNAAAFPTPSLPPEDRCKLAELKSINIAGGMSNSSQTAFIDQSQFNRKVLIELDMVPCDVVGASPVRLDTRFDIDSDWVTISGSKFYDGFSLPYSVSAGGSILGSGQLVVRRGEDLFGNRGDKYFMMASDMPVMIPPATAAAVLAIDLSATKIKPRDPAISGTFNVPLYVQAGSAQPLRGIASVRGQ